MQFHEFDSYDDYLEAQKALTRRKIGKGRLYLCTTTDALDVVVAHHINNERLPLTHAICHGVRAGHELRYFKEKFGRGEWLGTEIVEELCDGKEVVWADFSEFRSEWVRKFDFIYSNSLDHSNDPLFTLKMWMHQLSEDGRMYVEWTGWHDMLGRKGNKADCFAGTEDDYRYLMRQVGEIEAVLLSQDVGGKRPQLRKIFVVKHKSGT